jgi:uncharacterized membrane protein
MKTRRAVYSIIGIVLIVLNLLVDLAQVNEYKWNDNDTAYNIGSVIGGHILLIIGLVLLRLAYKLHKKIKSKEGNQLEESINSIGEDNK